MRDLLKQKNSLFICALLAAALFNLAFFGSVRGPETESQPLLGGPVESTSVISADALASSIAFNPEQVTGFAVVDGAFLQNPGNPLNAVLPGPDGLLSYKVKKGDTLSSVASHFGISVNDLILTNPELKQNKYLKIGQELVVLPVGDGSISNINSDAGVLPAELGKSSIHFSIPTTGWNWGKLHNDNAVDIANGCGTPIYAAADGLVTTVKSDGWNSGYGNYIVIKHTDDVFTRYAHNQDIKVAVGQYVLRGDQIATIGNTGNTHGPTGCHLHFEVVGTTNPFVKR